VTSTALRRGFSLAAAAVAAWLASTPTTAQAPPESQPRLFAEHLTYLGAFDLPEGDGRTGQLSYGGDGLGLGADGQSLYYTCIYASTVARVSIPSLGGGAAVLEPCQPVPNLSAINPQDAILVGGVLAWNRRLVVSAYSSYDANGVATRSHFAGPSIAQLRGPVRVGTERAGMVAGYMGVVPPEWRSRLGGPAFTGQCCLSIISRTSFGPSVSVFDPDAIRDTGTTPATLLVGYPNEHQTLGPYDGAGRDFGGTTRVGGVAFLPGSRSVLFIGRTGSTFCYGSGTSDRTLHGRPSGDGGTWCYDPTNIYKGPHGYPYRHQVWAYDAVDLALVAQGAKNPWDVVPYGVWTLTDIDGGAGTAMITSATYDPASRRLYVVADSSGARPEVHVYEITNAVLQPTRLGPQRFAVSAANGAWTFSWQPPSEPGWTAYQIEAGTAAGKSDIGVAPLAASTTSVTVPAPPSGTFFVRVRALYPDGGNPRSNELLVTAGAPVSTPVPTGVTATSSGATLAVSWGGAVGAAVSDVLLDAGTGPGLSNIVSGVSVGTSGTFVAGGVPPGRYYLRLRGVGQGGVSAFSNEANVIVGQPSGDVPGIPDEFHAAAAGRTVTLTWYAPLSGPAATGYLLDVGSRPGASDLAAGVALPPAMRFVVPDVPPGIYYLRLRAVNASGAGAAGPEVRLVVN
jgi:hypothetical protein